MAVSVGRLGDLSRRLGLQGPIPRAGIGFLISAVTFDFATFHLFTAASPHARFFVFVVTRYQPPATR